MSEINLNSKEWTDFVFDEKNKEYGAYNLRSTSSKRHVMGIILALVFTIVVALIPVIMNAFNEYRERNRPLTENLDESREMTEMKIEDQVPEENIVKQETPPPPPPPLKTTIRFVPPVIATADEVAEEVEVHTNDDIAASTDQVSVADVIGVDTDDAIDIADIQDQQVVVEETQAPLDFVEQMPQFPGGQAAMLKWIADNLQYPVIAAENGKQGRVTVKFVVDKEGSISNVQVVKGVFPALDQEAIRVINKMPKWNPGRQNGKAVAVNFTIPVTFKLQ